MSLATLKVKVQKLIEQAVYKKYWQKIWNMEPIDCIVPDNITDVSEEWYLTDLPLMDKLIGKNVEVITTDMLSTYAKDELTYVDLPQLIVMDDSLLKDAKKLVEVNTPSVTIMNERVLFGCSSLTTLKVGTLTSTTLSSFYMAVKGTASKLEFIEIGKGTSASLYLQNSIKYSQETLHNLIDNLADMTGKEAPVFSVGTTNIAKISDEYLQKLKNKNWNYQ